MPLWAVPIGERAVDTIQASFMSGALAVEPVVDRQIADSWAEANVPPARAGQAALAVSGGDQPLVGKPRSMALDSGSGQRDVTTLGRV